MPAGISAVLGSSASLFVAVLSAALLQSPLPARQVVGIAAGLGGIVLLASTAPTGDVVPSAVCALLLSAASWAIGSLSGRRASVPSDLVVSVAIPMLLGGLSVLPFALGEAWAGNAVRGRLDGAAIGGLTYLVVTALTSIASCVWLNRRTSSALANTFAYVAPVLALALRSLLLGESLTWYKLAAAACTLLAVGLIMASPAERR